MRPVTEEDIANFKEMEGRYFWSYIKDDPEPVDVAISREDLMNGSPKLGDMIARNIHNPREQRLISEEDFKTHYESVYVSVFDIKE